MTSCNATSLDIKNSPIPVALETPSMDRTEARLSASYPSRLLENNINLLTAALSIKQTENSFSFHIHTSILNFPAVI